MATLATCRTLAGEVVDEWPWGMWRPNEAVRLHEVERQLLLKPTVGTCLFIRAAGANRGDIHAVNYVASSRLETVFF